MAKRKSQKDPEELPDAPEGSSKGKRKNADSGSDSDSVCITISPPLERALMKY